MGARNRGGIGLSYRPARAGIFKKSMGARHREGIRFSYRPARLHRLAEFIPWNQCRGPKNIYKYGLWLIRLAEFIPRNRFLGSLNVALAREKGRLEWKGGGGVARFLCNW
jgi:hypothetical protein